MVADDQAGQSATATAALISTKLAQNIMVFVP